MQWKLQFKVQVWSKQQSVEKLEAILRSVTFDLNIAKNKIR